MFINVFNNNGIPYLRLVESQRYTASDGTRKVKKVTILNIGSLNKFDDGKPNYLERLKKSFQKGEPLIPILKPYCNTTPKRKVLRLELDLNDSDLFIPSSKLISNHIFEKFLDELGIISCLHRCKADTKIQYDVTGFFRLLIYSRLLKPCSKIEATRLNDHFLHPIIKDFYEYNVYDTLDFIHHFKDKIIKKINQTLVKKMNRTTDVVYYDVTNFYTETLLPDEDYEDENGEIIKGIRKMGVSKENRKSPIVQMGLFMDSDGIPISIETFPGNTLDYLSVIPSIENTMPSLGINKFIFVGDRGMYRGNNVSYLLENNNGYIISKSIQKTTALEKRWIFDDSDYIYQSDSFKYKSKIINRKVKNHHGFAQNYSEKVVVYWSKKFYDKQMHENKTFLELLDHIATTPENFRITKLQQKKLNPFIKKELIQDETGEIIDASKIKMIIDYEKVNKFVQSFGYYQLVTSEIDKSELEIISLYGGLNEIEQQFRILKSELEARPFYVRTKEHIEAHFIICTVALIITRLLQIKIRNHINTGVHPHKKFEIGMSLDRMRDAFNQFTVARFHGELYRIYNVMHPDLQIILQSLGIELENKFYKTSELKKIKDSFKIFK